MNILLVMGSPNRTGNAARLADKLTDALHAASPDAVIERVHLGSVGWKQCIGCHSCIVRGEDTCPLGDGFAEIRRKVERADGLVLVTPVYCMGVSFLMKQFLDRFAYLWHRPRFFGKYAIVACVGAGAGPVAKPVLSYMADNLARWGVSVVGSVGVVRFDTPVGPKTAAARDAGIVRLARRLVGALSLPRLPVPGIGDLFWFNVWRQAALMGKASQSVDYRYWNERGWLSPGAVYFYETPVSPLNLVVVRTALAAASVVMRRMND